MDRLSRAFDSVRAEEALKQNTAEFLRREIQRREQRPAYRVRYVLCCLAMLILMLGGAGGYSIYRMPVSYISIDVNPSVELALNRFDRVVDATARNEDGERILEPLKLTGMPYLEAIDLLLTEETLTGYLSQDALLSFTVASEKEAELVAAIEQCRQYREYESVCYGVETEMLEDAHQYGMSFGKYRACLELSQQDSTVTLEACKGMTMREIRQRLHAASEDAAEGQSDATAEDTDACTEENSTGHGYGSGSGDRGGTGVPSGNGNGYGAGNGTGNGIGNGSDDGAGTGYGHGADNGNGAGSGNGYGEKHGRRG